MLSFFLNSQFLNIYMYIYKKKSFKNNYEYRIRADLEVSYGSSPERTPPSPSVIRSIPQGIPPCKKQIESAHVDTSHSYIVNASPHDVFFSKESKTLGKVVGFVIEQVSLSHLVDVCFIKETADEDSFSECRLVIEVVIE